MLQVDEAMELLDGGEYQAMTERQKVAIEAAEEVSAYGKEFAVARKALGGGECHSLKNKIWDMLFAYMAEAERKFFMKECWGNSTRDS